MTTQTGCQKCGRPVEAGAQFCANCGANVSDAQGSLATAMMAPTDVAQQLQDMLLEHLREAALGEYEVLTELGRGGMATVYLAHDIQLDRKVAIKVMLPTLLEGEGMAERFKLEARTAAQLSHPHIIPIYAVRDTEQLVYFVMKFVEGRALDSICSELGKLPLVMVQHVLSKVGDALGYAHRRGVVHRDIKPANIMIDVEGLPVVTDFGIAKVADAVRLTMTGATVGTPTYMSPEQCSAGTITGSSDQYSLGVVAYQMLSGQPPFGGDSLIGLLYKHCHEPPPPFMELRPDCPPALHDAVMRMLAKTPEARFPSLEAAVEAIGSPTLGFDHPIRNQLVDLARKGGNLDKLKRVSTPRSPTPIRSRVGGRSAVATPTKRVGARTVGATVQAAPAGPAAAATAVATAARPTSAAPPRRSRAPLWIGAAVVVIGIGATAWLRPWERGGAPPTAAAPAVASLSIQPASGSLDVGGALQLAAVARDTAGTAMTAPVQWSSEDPTVAAVTPSGQVQALAAGTTRIRATAGGAVGFAEFIIAAAPAAPAGVSAAAPPSATPPRPGRPGASQPVLTPAQTGAATARAGTTQPEAAAAPAPTALQPAPSAAAPAPAPTQPAPAAPAPAPAAPAPTVSPREAIAGVIQQYARALQSGNPAEVRRVYPGLSRSQADQVEALGSYDQLRVQLRMDALDVQGDDASASVSGEYQFYSRENRRNERLPVRVRMSLRESDGTWHITAVQ